MTMRRNFLLKPPYFLEPTFFLRVLIAAAIVMAGMSILQDLTKREEPKVQLAVLRMAAIRLFDYYQWPTNDETLKNGSSVRYGYLARFARGDDVHLMVPETPYNEVEGITRLIDEALRLPSGEKNWQRRGELIAVLGSEDALKLWEYDEWRRINENDGGTWGVGLRRIVSDFRSYFLERKDSWRPSAGVYERPWDDSIQVLEYVAMWKVRLHRVAEMVCAQQDRLIDWARLLAVALGAVLIHRFSQRRIASLLARHKAVMATTWAVVNFLACVPLLELLRHDFDDYRRVLGYYQPQGVAIVIGAALAFIYAHQLYRLSVCWLDARSRREIIFRVCVLLLSIIGAISVWVIKAKLYPGYIYEGS